MGLGLALPFALAIILMRLLSIAFRLEKTAYRWASITVAIIVLIPRSARAQTIALRRFVEVSVGIIVALVAVGAVAGPSTKCGERAQANSWPQFSSGELNITRSAQSECRADVYVMHPVVTLTVDNECRYSVPFED